MDELGFNGQSFFCSWSGGKDSCLALHRAINAGGRPRILLTMMHEEGERSRSHGLSASVLRYQASCLGIPIMMRPTTWEDYEASFVEAMGLIRDHRTSYGVFGDIDLEEHREWVQKVCAIANITAVHPLWGEQRQKLLKDFLDTGFKATVIAVKNKTLDRRFLGKELTRDLVQEFEREGIDASGELGEYHTVVTDGPLFSRPLRIAHGESQLRDGYWFLDISASV